MLRHVSITPFNAALAAVAMQEFPTVSINRISPRKAEVRIAVPDWRTDSFDFASFDAEIESVSSLAIEKEDCSHPASVEILTRAQRMIGRRNEFSAIRGFDEVLQRHSDLHDFEVPWVREEYDHAVDCWQWMLRLAGAATLSLQIAALFHDAERLISPAVPDSPLFRDAQARAAAEITRRALSGSLVGESTVAEAADLVATHQRESRCPNVALLNDADALSFFSLRSGTYLEKRSEEEARAEFGYRLSRMSPAARARLSAVRLQQQVASLIAAS